jgi:hypothetical protein
MRSVSEPFDRTPTPNPSPQGGGGLGWRSLAQNRRRLEPDSAAAKFPSPLWGGVRGGGAKPAELTEISMLLQPSTVWVETEPTWYPLWAGGGGI